MGAADIVINTVPPQNPCVMMNPTKSTDKLHVVNNVNLQKCCKIGWHLDSNKTSESSALPCFEGDQNVTIDMIFRDSKNASFFEILELRNYSVQVSKFFTRSVLS
jgi:hypothetical protein